MLIGDLRLENQVIDRARAAYFAFIRSCTAGDCNYRFTSRSECSSFAFCFAIFGLHLLQQTDDLSGNAEYLAQRLKTNLMAYKTERESFADLKCDKPFLQLLTFSLSSLFLLNQIQSDPLEEVVVPLLSHDVAADLDRVGALEGVPQSGNLAMFMAVLLIHARDYLGINTQKSIDTWVELHLEAMNPLGFWGCKDCMTHLQFQNGYHQYEVLEYLDIDNPKAESAAANVEALADQNGHFAPYPGGGGCYDYDAVTLLTQPGAVISEERMLLLQRTALSILGQQNSDGGFSESHKVRPRSRQNLLATAKHVLSACGSVRKERLRYALTLLRPKHNRIHTHWSVYSRKWNESDLWDSWFRMMAVARIESVLNSSVAGRWGFIDYPGIGYYQCPGV